LKGEVTNSTISLSAVGAITVKASFDYTAKVTITGSITGKGTVMFTTSAVTFTKTDVLPGKQTGTIVINFLDASFTWDATFGDPTAANQKALIALMIPDIAKAYPNINTDVQTAVTAFYDGKSWTKSLALETSLPSGNYTYDLALELAPVYNNSGNMAVIYPLAGNLAPTPIPPTPEPTVKKNLRGFLKMIEDNVVIIPNFNETDAGTRQVSLTTKSLVYDLVKNISDSKKFTFPVSDANKLSGEFKVNADYLSQIYPGILSVYPRDAVITVNAVVSDISLTTFTSGQATVTFTVTDSTQKTILTFASTVSFAPGFTTTTLNFYVSSITHMRTVIVASPYGFVDASTLGEWIDDAFSNYNSNSWSLFAKAIDFSSVVGTIKKVTVNDTTILVGGN
jgi:hypothetical protein